MKYPCIMAGCRGVMAGGRARQGFTLMEVLMASVVLSLAVAAISQAVLSGQSHTYESLHRMRASALGQALMEEATALPYPVALENGSYPARPGRRALYDSIDDFQGYAEAAGSLEDQTGVAYDEPYQVYSRAVAVSSVTLDVAGLGQVHGLEVKVTVADVRGKTWELVRFMPQPTAEVTP